MKAVKRRDKFIASLCKEQKEITGQEYSEEDFYKDFESLGEMSKALAKLLWAYCRENGLDSLP